ncbi:MAG TPA: NUDIX hydrolase [Xanthobacteraceae bacterium]|jgi:8-oxo-dGTP pyrophosphatase MutT (NUDIX family)
MTDSAAERVERLNEFTRRQEDVGRSRPFPRLRPKDAATLILIDRSGPVPKVLLGKRHERHSFMPGKIVFPGGGVDPSDKRMPVARELDKGAEARLMQRCPKASPVRARALALAAIRETGEETGLLLGVRGKPGRIPAGPWFPFAAHDVLPDLGAIYFVGRAITPPGRPRRFDARFFTMDASAIAHRIEGVTGPEAEFVELLWMPLEDAMRMHLPAVTSVMLEELDARIANGLGHDLPVPFYRMLHGSFLRELL